MKHVPYPSVADLGYLLVIPCFFVAIALLIRHRVGHFTLTRWLDGAIAALAAAAGACAVLAPALIGLTKGDPAAVATNLAYPVGDLLLIAMIVGAIAVSGLRGARTLLLIGVGLLTWTGADVVYLWSAATNSAYSPWVDSLWLIGAGLIAFGVLDSPRVGVMKQRPYQASMLVPAISSALAVAILIYDHFERLPTVSVWLAGATVAAVAARLLLSHRDNARLISVLHVDSVTDPLTGLPNRRALLRDFGQLFARGEVAGAEGEYVCVIFDLDGFKAYNDSFGHPAGDALLRRLGASLSHVIAPFGTAYRLGGDEFCVLSPIGDVKADSILATARAALSERGEGFTITASGGAIILPREADNPSDAMRIADQRMYQEKGDHHARSGHQVRELLLGIMRAHEPGLETHVNGVARLAMEVGRELNLDSESLDVLVRASEMHDIGKIGIPEDVLHKPGPLTDIEWELVHSHPMIGARIISSAPALMPVAKLVRSAHERWDGQGYCDGLAGTDIPLGSRIIFVCDAFDAMTEDRPYRRAFSPEKALQEIRENSGSQFDPDVVDAFLRVAARLELLAEAVPGKPETATHAPSPW